MSESVQVLFAGDAGAVEGLAARLAPLPVRLFDAADRDPAVPCVILVPPGPEAAARVSAVRARAPGVPVVAALRAAGAADLRALLEAGADAVAAEGLDAAGLRALVLSLATVRDATTPEGTDALTPRESEVLRLLSAGYSNKEVARRLAVSVRTVESHRLNLRRKTRTGRLRDLVQLARHLGLQPVVEAGGGGEWRGGLRPSRPAVLRQVGGRFG